MENTFSIDLTALYEYIGDSKTKYGYYIDHEEDGVNVWNDLRQSCPSTLFACDGETCGIIAEFVDSVYVYNDANVPFWLSKDEFDVCCHHVVDY